MSPVITTLQIHLLIFLHLADQFFEASRIDEIICIKLPNLKTNFAGDLTRIVTSVMLYGLYGNINLYSLYMSGT